MRDRLEGALSGSYSWWLIEIIKDDKTPMTAWLPRTTFAQGWTAHRDWPSKTCVVIIGHKRNRLGEPNMECHESRHQGKVEEATV